ncbi:hypothetical protein ACK3YP_04760 [Aeromonas allosaccharophila]|uniref:hypothetical protein n=1 Tax=Aeromonas allosaccharophila TaxID=656 RepID=UPI0039879BD2
MTLDAMTIVIIEKLIEQRNTGRANKDWVAADQARNALTEFGVGLIDNQGKTKWYIRA